MATLWLEVSPNVPSAAAWSARSLPRFPLGPHTGCMVNRSFRSANIFDWPPKCVSCKTRCLTCVGASRSDDSHEANPSFHAITKVSRVFTTLAVFVMGINKGVKETQHHNPALKTSWEITSDQVVQKMITMRRNCSMSLERARTIP